MGKKGSATQEKILNIAQALILQKGFSGTSLDEIIDKANLTKGGFFYHFSGKNDLAKRLLQRYLDQDEAFFNALFERADSLSEDPLQQMLIFLKLYAEAVADLEETHPGCLVASYTYEDQQFDDEIRELAAQGMLSWQRLFEARLQAIANKYPLKLETSLTELADMLTSVIEGSIVVSRVLRNQQVSSQQLQQYRSHLRLLFGDV